MNNSCNLTTLSLQMTKVSRSRECDECERLIPSSSREDEVDERTASAEELTRSESPHDIPIESSPLIDRRRLSR